MFVITKEEMFNVLCLGRQTVKVFRHLLYMTGFKSIPQLKINTETMCKKLHIHHRSTIVRALRKLESIDMIRLERDGKAYRVKMLETIRGYI